MPDVVRRRCKQSHSFNVFVLEQRIERLVRFRAFVCARQTIAPLGPQVADGFDKRVRMLVKLERRPKASADYADAQFTVRGDERQRRSCE